MTCLSGAALGAVSALVKERSAAAWKIGWDLKLLTVAYSVHIDGHFVYFLILHLVSFK